MAEITFAEWPAEGMIWQANFEGLREDKKPAEVVWETVQQTEEAIQEA